MSTGNMLG